MDAALPPEPPLCTPPGSPSASPQKVMLSASQLSGRQTKGKKYELDVASPRDSQESTNTLDGGSDAVDVEPSARAGTTKIARRKEHGGGDAYDDLSLDATVCVVTKSIFKEKKGGFLSRLRDASSSVKNKYAPSETSHAVLPVGTYEPETSMSAEAPASARGIANGDTGSRQHDVVDNTNERVEIVLEEEEPIDVAIDQATPLRRETVEDRERMAVPRRKAAPKHVEDGESNDAAPQVVIHSTESDSDSAGFATLNPVINRPIRGKRGSASAVTSGPTGVGANPPVLLSLPIAEDDSEAGDRSILVINALGATGLIKVEKFGTQSTQLEMRLCGISEELSSGATHLSYLRTALHKKGGSEAQWNQQFTTSLRSNTQQMLHAAVRTHSKLLVGEARIPLVHVTDTLYDQHYPLYRTTNDGRHEDVGQIHLQLRIADASQLVPTNPPAQVLETRLLPVVRGPIPPVLRNGALMFKIPYHSHALMGPAASKRQWIAVSGDGVKETVCITWCDPIDTTEKSRRLDASLITEIRDGARTKAFERLLQYEPSSVARETERCFSIISSTRTLDIVASSKEEAQIWVLALRQLVFSGGLADSDASDPSARTIRDFKHSAMTTRDSTTLSNMSTTAKKQQLQQWRSTVFDYARQHDLEAIDACLHDGCPIDLLETGTGDTLLMLACRVGDAKLVKLCLLWRAKNDPHPEFGETALQVAVNAGHTECLDLILRTAAKSDMDSEIVNHIDSNNDAPLHVAARKGDLACMQLLLHHGADICVVEEFGRTPLHCAALSGKLDCVAYLLDVGGDSILNAGDHDGDTALHYAALAGEESVVKLLLESAADVQSANIHGETPYDLADREQLVGCAKLIGKYFHTGKTEASIPVERNETVSSLLMLQQKEEPLDYDQTTDAMDDEDADEDPQACIEPSNSPVRRGPIEPLRRHETCGDFYEHEEYYVPHSSRRISSVSRYDQAISPSARVREVLATHRERMAMQRPSPVPALHFHSARDDFHSRYPLDAAYGLPVRQAYTERYDRDQVHYAAYHQSHHPSYHLEELRHPYELHRRSVDPYMHMDDRGYPLPQITSRGRSMSALGSSGYLTQHAGGYDQYGRWYDDSVPSQRPNTAEAHHQHADAWHQPAQISIHPAQPPPVPRAEPEQPDVWDTYYSDDGYPYYVNRITGVSQWENPYEAALAQVVPATRSTATLATSEARAESSATGLARKQLADARRNRTVPSTEPAAPSTSTTDVPRSVDEVSQSRIVASSIATSESASTLNRCDSLLSSPCESPTSSKYESRTGLRLSIDISSPQRQDDSRPVFVPSPRAKSPRKASDARCVELSDPSFEKSTRASSPRGKTKSVQLMELKRANNLAMALASFRINDRNDQIVQAITTLDEKVVNAEFLVCLQRFFPTDEEAALLRSYEGPVKSLGNAERFFFQLLQVTDVSQRIECFLYKLQFARSYRTVYSKMQVVKRACRDLVENYSFVEALNDFFKKLQDKSLQAFRGGQYLFQTEYLQRMDEKLHSYHEDLQKAADIELLDVQLQINRLIAGIRPVQAFVERTSPPEDQDIAAHDTLHRFLVETRGKLNDLETEYEALGQWEDKVLGLFGESKASCQLAPILECLCSVLDKASY